MYLFLHRMARIHVQRQQQQRQCKWGIFTVNVFRVKDKLGLLCKQLHVDIESTAPYATFAKIAVAIVIVEEF
jgi:hypothetical protein